MLDKIQMPLTDQLAQNAQGYLSQGNQAPTPTVLNSGSQIPASQQSFSAPGTTMNPNTPSWGGGPTYVPGVGILGPDLGGAVKGTLLKQQYTSDALSNNRAEETVGMAKTKLAQDQDYLNMAKESLGAKLADMSIQDQPLEYANQVQQGMVSAAQQGGFSGVVDYLSTADPNRALAFQASKLKMDDMIRGSQVAQAALPGQMAQVMANGYQTIGKMAAAIMNAPESQRAAMYKQMYPMANIVLGGHAPTEYGADSQALGMMAMAQATPENLLFANQGFASYAQTEIGKLNLAKNSLLQKGFTLDSPEVQQIQNQIKSTDLQAQGASLQAANASQDILNKKLDGVNKSIQMNLDYSTKLQDSSKEFTDNMKDYAKVYTLADYVKQAQDRGDNTGVAEGLLKLGTARAFAGRPSSQALQNIAASNGWEKVSNDVEGWFKGEKVNLKPWEVSQVVTINKALINQEFNQQLALEDQWKQNATSRTMTDQNGKQVPVIDWDTMPLPSKTYQSLIDPKSNQQQQLQMTKDQIDKYASEVYASKEFQSGQIKPQQIEQIRQEQYMKNGLISPNSSTTGPGSSITPNGTGISKLGIGG